MRGSLLALLAAAAASPLLAGPGGGVIVYTAPDGGHRVANIAPAFAAASVPTGLEDRRRELWPVVERLSRANGLDPQLVDLVIRMESGYNSRAVSRRGARGVMQLMPETARMYGVRDMFDASENIRGGVSYLRDLMSRFEANVGLALAAYNAGPEAVSAYGGVPPYEETRGYVRAILAAYSGASSTEGPLITNRGSTGGSPIGRRLGLR
jgi:soluble lytic murein transglycosylase-like protein